MHIHCDFLTTSSPAEEKICSIGGNCSRWRMRASCLITLASVSTARSVRQISQVVSMKFLHPSYLNEIISGGVTLQNNFLKIISKI